MAEPVVSVLFQMVSIVISNTIGTLASLASLFFQFMESMGLVMGSGLAGLTLGFLIIGIVLFFLAKFVFSSGKTIIMLIAAAVVLLIVMTIGLSVA